MPTLTGAWIDTFTVQRIAQPVSRLELNQTAAGRLDLTHVVPNSHDLSP